MNCYLKQRFALVAMLLLSAFTAFAGIKVTGTVVDESGEPLVAATVMEVGAKQGTLTDISGKYTLEVSSAKAELKFSYVGYNTVSEIVGSRSVINVTMTPLSSMLQETVVIGYGRQKKADVTSSVQSVKAEDFNAGAVSDAGALIQGKVAGLQITQSSGDPTASSSMLLRGFSSLLGNTSPLVLVDGVPGNLSTVAPQDIESIDVLKDGSATAIYGTRGTNGVIIITTKSANREMPLQVQYDGYVAFSKWTKKPSFLTASDLRAKIAEGWVFSGANDKDYGDNVDYLDQISQTAISHVHNLSIMGGTKHNSYTANLTYDGREGVIRNTGSRHLSGRLQVVQFLFDDKLKLSAEILATETKNKRGFDPNYVYRLACIQNPTQPIKNQDGTWVERSVYFYDNPVSYIEERTGDNRTRTYRFSGIAEYRPINELTLKAMYVRKGQNTTFGSYYTHNDVTTTESGYNGYAYRSSDDFTYNMVELSADFNKKIGLHTIGAVIGYDYEDNTYEAFNMSNRNFPTDQYTYNNIGTGMGLKDGIASMYSNKYSSKLIGLFARVTYNFADRYLVMASFRRDGSSKFGADYKWGNFPGVSVGWRINNESFMKEIQWLDNLKLRAGFGITGIDVNSPYQSLATLDYSGYYLYGGQWIQTLTPVRNENKNLRWEKKYEYNLGLDFAVLNNRLSGSVDIYQRDTKDGLFNYSVPSPPYQYSSMMANVCHIRNRGVEVLINAIPIVTRDFSWNASISYSSNTNKLVSLQNDEFKMSTDYFDTGYTGEPIQTTTHRVKEGWAIGNFYGLKSVGLNSNGKWVVERFNFDENGEPTSKYYDLAENANSNDWQILGNGVPRFNLSFNNRLMFKQWDLAISMRGAFGFQLLNFQKMYYGNPNIQYNVLRCAFDPLPVVDQRTGVATGEKSIIKDSQRYVSYYVEDGDYWKIDNITLGYTFNFKSKYLKSIRLYANVHNLITFTKYSGLDPEVRMTYGSNGYDPGTDERDKYPTTRTFTIGANIKF
mgnify:FL=1